jgi:hypothetical protein
MLENFGCHVNSVSTHCLLQAQLHTSVPSLGVVSSTLPAVMQQVIAVSMHEMARWIDKIISSFLQPQAQPSHQQHHNCDRLTRGLHVCMILRANRFRTTIFVLAQQAAS